MFNSASVLCKEITQQLVDHWVFSGSLINTDIQDHIPKKLYTFICWVIQGPASSLQTSSCEMSVLQNVMAITQNILYAFKNECQVQYKPKNEESLFCIKDILKNRTYNFSVETSFHQFSNMASSGLKKMFILQFYIHKKFIRKYFPKKNIFSFS